MNPASTLPRYLLEAFAEGSGMTLEYACARRFADRIAAKRGLVFFLLTNRHWRLPLTAVGEVVGLDHTSVMNLRRKAEELFLRGAPTKEDKITLQVFDALTVAQERIIWLAQEEAAA